MEFLAAVIFMLGAGSLIFIGALFYGSFKFFFALVLFIISIIVSGISDPSIYLEIESYAGLLTIPGEFIQPFKDFFSQSWNWARYEEPMLAFIIGAALIAVFNIA